MRTTVKNLGLAVALCFSFRIPGQSMIPDTKLEGGDSPSGFQDQDTEKSGAIASGDTLAKVTSISLQDKAVTQPDTTRSDTLAVKGESRPADLEGPVSYEAVSIETLVDERKMILTGRAKISYLDMTLTAENITVEWEKNTLYAEGVWDSVWVKKENRDSVRTLEIKGAPEFTEAGDIMRGEVMTYNFKTRKGRVTSGRTTHEDGFYHGNTIKMVKPRSLNISDATFTTCDLAEDPHFHFWFDKMKIDINEKVIAKPIIMYLGNIPVLALPFAYFPIQKGRQSGILFPRYGVSSLEGNYLRGLGYYWAASDYWDVKGQVDYFERSGVLFRGDLNYAVRYKMSGSISGSVTHKDFDVSGVKERRWDFTVHHSQTLSQSAQLLVSGQFVSSGNFYRDLSANREQRLQQQIRSNATLTKRFGGSTSLTVNLSQTRDLDSDEITETLPRMSFRAGQTAIFSRPESRRGEVPVTRWYHNLYISYQSDFLLQRTKRKSLSGAEDTFDKKQELGWDHSLRFSSPQKILSWFTVNPSVNYRETWFDQRDSYFYNPETGEFESQTEKGFFARRTFDMATSLSTKVYGLFAPRFLNQVYIRHVATPSVSFRFRPDFSDPFWGYYQTVEDTLGTREEYDRYYGSAFGSTQTGAQKSMNFSVQNVFQMKTGDGDQVKKLDLFSWNVSTAYNWEAEKYKLSDISSSVQARPFKNMNLNISSTHSFYDTDEKGNKTDRFLADPDLKNWKSLFGWGWTRITNASAGLDIRLRGTAKGGGSEASQETKADLDPLRSVSGDRMEMDEAVSGFDIPWDMTATLRYSLNQYNPLHPEKTLWANLNLNLNFTPHWKVSYRARFDVMEKEVVSQDIVFYRDMHCWEARIVWVPTGYYKRFYFKINVKSTMLQDIKFEKGSGRSMLYGY